MKKFGILVVLLSLGLFNVGCDDKAKAPAPTTNTPVTTDTKTSPNGSTSTDTKKMDAAGGKTEVKTETPPTK